MRKLLAVLALVSLGACVLEKSHRTAPKEPTIEGGAESQEYAICEETDPLHCVSGYGMEAESSDGTNWLCVLVIGCPVVSDPCKYGEQAGDPTFQVRCRVSER